MTKSTIKKYLRHVRRLWLLAKRWWHRNDRKYGLWWRLGNGTAAVLIVVATLIPVLQQINNSNSYKLSADALKLVGSTDAALKKQLTYDNSTHTYQFNKGAVKSTDSSNPLAAMKTQIGTASGKKNDKSLYALDVPTDISKGVTYHDVNSQVSFSLVPEFKGSAGKDVDGHLVFPLSGGNQAIYTLKNNGLKEDIVVPKATEDSMTFSYKLNLPKTLEAKAIPDSGGDIGIYSGDPTLFGNISYGSDKDRAVVEKAREHAAKTYLVFGLPAPVIKDTKGNEVGSARFELNGNQLTVVASGLAGLHTPVTIDPSVVVTSTSDFQTGNNEGNIDFNTSDQVTRGALTGGTVSGGWTASSLSLTQNLERFGSFVYNGRLCYLGGVDKATNTWNQYVYCSTINTSNGTLSGSWSTVGNINNGDMNCGSLAVVSNSIAIYNSTLYVIGNSCNGTKNLEYYATFKSNGTLNPWVALPNLPVNNDSAGIATYNGYIYMVGGGASSGVAPYYNTVYYASLNADGSMGSWTLSPNTLVQTIGMGEAVAYNGYLYIVAGANGSGFSTDVEFAKINSDGSVGTWRQTSAYSTARYGQIVYAYNGYLYTVGGWGHNDTQYAQINANGTLGAWQTSASYSTTAGERYLGGAAYNGYIYIMGGRNESTGNSTSGISYAKIDPAGVTTGYSSGPSLPTSPYNVNGGTLAYNGYLYAIGGYNGTNPSLNTVYYSAIAANGSMGSWTATTTLNTGTYLAGYAAYNGYLYVMGGITTGTTTTAVVQYATVNSNGTTGTWNTTTALPAAAQQHPGTAYNGYMYYSESASGGGGATTQIYYNSINSNGTLGATWALTSLTKDSINQYGMVPYGGYMYVMGGVNSSSTTIATTEYAPINADGTLGTWNYTSTMNHVRDRFGAFVINGYMYAIGGETNSTDNNSTEYAPINADGTLGTWVDNTSIAAGTYSRGGFATYNGYIYLTGGFLGGTRTSATYYAAVNNGGSGTTGTWSTSANAMAQKVYYSGFATYNGYLYALSGSVGGGNNYAIQHALINTDGSIGTWVTDSTTTPSAYSVTSATAYNGYIYLIGGLSGGSPQSGVYYAALSSSDGSVGTLQSTASLNTARFGNAVAQYGGYVYVLGGCKTVNLGACTATDNSVEFAPFNSNGTLGTWHYTHASTDDGTSFVAGFTSNRYAPSAFAYSGYLYVVGGCTNYSSNACATANAANDVQYAQINSDGTIGTWSTTTSFPTGRYQFGMGAYDGFVYIVGGNAGSNNYLNDVQYAPLNANGTIGTWSGTTSFTTARYGLGAGVYNDNIYMYGGCSISALNCNSGSGTQSDVQYASLQSIARTAHYSNLIDLGATANVTSVTYNGVLPTGNSAITYRAAGSNGVFGSSALASDISGSAGCIGTTTNTRYIFISVTLDDSYGLGTTGGTFPDSVGTHANLTDLSVNYNPVHPPPNIRLRAGQTLQQGNLSALDTCYP